jgi:ABC-type multidrug transport system fused ATPase/permease subunit
MTCATALALSGVEIGSAFLVRGALDGALEVARTGGPAGPTLVGLLGLLLVGGLARGYLLTRQRLLAGLIGERVAARLRTALWRRLQSLPLDTVRKRGPGQLLVRFVSDARAVQRLVGQGLVRLGQDCLVAGAILFALGTLDWRMALPVGLVPLGYGALFCWLNPALRRRSRAVRRRRARMSGYLGERIAGLAVVKLCRGETTEVKRVGRLSRDLAGHGARLAAASGRLQGGATALVALGSTAALVIGVAEAVDHRVSAGTLVAFFMLVGQLNPVLRRIASANRMVQEAQVSVERLVAALAEPTEAKRSRSRQTLTVTAGSVRFEKVSFGYGGGAPALDEVSLRVERGELVVLVGPNGAGKSSLLELLLGLRAPDRGRILIDGQDVSKVSLASLRSQIGAVGQDAPLFAGTLAENVGYGLPDGLSPSRRVEVARLAGLEELLSELPDGWESQLGQGGQRLSAGQRQRVVLARALASDPPILALDEAASALDGETERALALRLRALAAERTVLVAAHRLPTLLAADRIYVVERGRVVAVGAHEQLLASGGTYTRLFGPLPQPHRTARKPDRPLAAPATLQDSRAKDCSTRSGAGRVGVRSPELGELTHAGPATTSLTRRA